MAARAAGAHDPRGVARALRHLCRAGVTRRRPAADAGANAGRSRGAAPPPRAGRRARRRAAGLIRCRTRRREGSAMILPLREAPAEESGGKAIGLARLMTPGM